MKVESYDNTNDSILSDIIEDAYIENVPKQEEIKEDEPIIIEEEEIKEEKPKKEKKTKKVIIKEEEEEENSDFDSLEFCTQERKKEERKNKISVKPTLKQVWKLFQTLIKIERISLSSQMIQENI